MLSIPLSRSSLVIRCLFSFGGGIFFTYIVYYVLSSKIHQEFFSQLFYNFFFLLAHHPSLYQPLYYLRRMFPIYDFLSNKKRSTRTYTLLYDISNKKYICKSDWFFQPSCKGKKRPNFHPLDLEILMFNELQNIVNWAILVAQSCAHQDCENLHIVELSIKPHDQG